MALVANIRSTLSGIGVKFADGVVEYRTMTSAPNAATRTYSAWTTLASSRIVEQRDTQVQDPDSGIWYREETCQLRVPYQVGVALSLRDQIRAGSTAGAAVANQVWSIRDTLDAADGAVKAYSLYRRTPMMGNPRTGGGV